MPPTTGRTRTVAPEGSAPVEVRELEVAGAYEFTPKVFSDHRGLFVTTYQDSVFAAVLGRPFPVAQAAHSRSRRGVVRGVHFTTTPPGVAKHVHCARGRALDFVVDLRVGSPTFGRWDSVELDPERYRAVYLPVGVGHAFSALEDDTVLVYLMSGEFAAEHEQAVSIVDPDLGLPLPDERDLVMSDRDRAAIGLAQARERGLLPDYSACLEAEAGR